MSRRIVVFFLSVFITSCVYFLSFYLIYAEDFRNDYQVEYFLSESQNKLNTKVKFKITITNLAADLYVKQFSLGFPKSFQLHNVRAYDDHVEITPKLEDVGESTKISLEFSDPKFGRGSSNTLYLEFFQDNLFTINGNVWEVIIPTVDNHKDSHYKVLVHLPVDTDRKISIAKPKPSSIDKNTITWDNPESKTIYAVFGDVQYFKTDLTYNLKNEKLIPVYTDVAFPPDTLLQKIFVNKVEPAPTSITVDSDGNYLARYVLKPREEKIVTFKGTIAVFAKVRDELVPTVRNQFAQQKKYLLNETKYWTIPDKFDLKELNADPKSIFKFVTNMLTYDYSKVTSSNTRLGAGGVLNTPDRAVCMEFTDLFVALARKKGIYAREIEGYGFSQDSKLRPLSLVSDVLHSWPEYYDDSTKYWVPIDPTWEDTSGIDYFSSFDLNHITFAIHAKDSDYPYPAGTYKTSDSQDVHIEAIADAPRIEQKLELIQKPFATKINDTQVYKLTITVKNTGNVYYWEKNSQIVSKNVVITPESLQISPLAPGEEKTITLAVKSDAKSSTPREGYIKIEVPNSKSISYSFSIIPFYYDLALKFSFAVFVITSFAFILILLRRRQRKLHKSR